MFDMLALWRIVVLGRLLKQMLRRLRKQSTLGSGGTPEPSLAQMLDQCLRGFCQQLDTLEQKRLADSPCPCQAKCPGPG